MNTASLVVRRWFGPAASLLLFSVAANACTTTVEDDDDDGGAGGTSGAGASGGASAGRGGSSAAGGSESGGDAGAGTPNEGGADSGGAAGSSAGGETGEAGRGDAGAVDSGGSTGDGGTGSGGEAGEYGSGSGGGGVGGGGTVTPPSTDSPSDGGSVMMGPLVIKVTTSQNPALQGQSVLYTITIGNTSEVAVDDIDVLVRMPEGLDFYYTDANPDSSACGNGTCSPNEEATWSVGTLEGGATFTILFNPRVLNTVGDSSSLATALRVSAANLSPVNFTKTIGVMTEPSAELTLSSSADPAVPGQSVELSFDIGNVGAASLFEGELQAYLPVGLSATSASDGGDVSSDGRSIVWPVDSLGVGAALHRTAGVEVAAGLAPGQVLNAQATYVYEDGDEVDHWVQLPISVVAAKPPLSLFVNTTPSPAKPGGRALYTATVANTSLRAVDGVSLFFRVPREVEYYYTTHSEPDSSACGNGTCSSGEESVFQLGTLAAGATQTVSIDTTVVGSAGGDGSLVSTWLGLRANDVNPINVIESFPVNGAAAAQLALGAEFDPVTPGAELTYHLDVGQVGAASLVNTELRAILPSGVQIESVSDGGTAAGREVRWDLGTVAVAGSLHRSFTVTVDEEVPPATVLEARATLTYDGGAELDASAEAMSSVVAAPLPLTVSIDATPSPGTLGGRVFYTTTITNTSARAVDGLTLIYRVPTGLDFYYTTDADPDSSACGNGTCSAGEEAFWTLGTLAAGATQTVTVNPQLSSSIPGGSIVGMTGRLTGTNLGGTINLKKTIRTQNAP